MDENVDQPQRRSYVVLGPVTESELKTLKEFWNRLQQLRRKSTEDDCPEPNEAGNTPIVEAVGKDKVHCAEPEEESETGSLEPEEMGDDIDMIQDSAKAISDDVAGLPVTEVAETDSDNDSFTDVLDFLDDVHERLTRALEEFEAFERGEYDEVRLKEINVALQDEYEQEQETKASEDNLPTTSSSSNMHLNISIGGYASKLNDGGREDREDEAEDNEIVDDNGKRDGSPEPSLFLRNFLERLTANGLELTDDEEEEYEPYPGDDNASWLPHTYKVADLPDVSDTSGGKDFELARIGMGLPAFDQNRATDGFFDDYIVSSDGSTSEEDLSDCDNESIGSEASSESNSAAKRLKRSRDDDLQQKSESKQRNPSVDNDAVFESEFRKIDRALRLNLTEMEMETENHNSSVATPDIHVQVNNSAVMSPASTNPTDNLSNHSSSGSDTVVNEPPVIVIDDDAEAEDKDDSTQVRSEDTTEIEREIRRTEKEKRRFEQPRKSPLSCHSSSGEHSESDTVCIPLRSENPGSDFKEITLDDEEVQIVKDDNEIQFVEKVKTSRPTETLKRKGYLEEVIEILDTSSSDDSTGPSSDNSSSTDPMYPRPPKIRKTQFGSDASSSEPSNHATPSASNSKDNNGFQNQARARALSVPSRMSLYVQNSRRRTSSESSEEFFEDSKSIVADPSTKKYRRKKIRPIRHVKNPQLKAFAERSKEAEEESQKLQEINTESSRLILCVDPLIEIDRSIACKLKPHQREGIQFLWTLCICTVEKALEPGSGGILSHCMGLGKTVQALAFLQVLLTNPILGIKHCLVLCPLSVVQNWESETKVWFANLANKVNFFNISEISDDLGKLEAIKNYREKGGIALVHYELFRRLVLDCQNDGKEASDSCTDELPSGSESTNNPAPQTRAVRPSSSVRIELKAVAKDVLMNPDILVCDEGHSLKNGNAILPRIIKRIPTRRKIILTGTPMQNNLKEYYYIIDLVQPGILGELSLFANNFINPIANGQHIDSNKDDIDLSRRREYVLWDITNKFIHRKFEILRDFIPPKSDFGIFLNLNDLQRRLYNRYLGTFDERLEKQQLVTPDAPETELRRKLLFEAYQVTQKLCCHPLLLFKEFSRSGKNATLKITTKPTHGTTLTGEGHVPTSCWFDSLIEHKDRELISCDLNMSPKMIALKEIVQSVIRRGEKILIFSRFRYVLDLIQYFIGLDAFGWGTLILGQDYYRIDGRTPSKDRHKFCCDFNMSTRAKLLLITIKTGGLGVNLQSANRVIMLDVSMNPSDDEQSIFRVYRLGQEKECFIYRLICRGGMEEKNYNRALVKLAVGRRIVDTKHSSRLVKLTNTANMYEFNPESVPVGALDTNEVGDPVFQDMLRNCNVVASVVEHQSLLEDNITEHLDEQQKEVARLEEGILAQAQVEAEVRKRERRKKVPLPHSSQPQTQQKQSPAKVGEPHSSNVNNIFDFHESSSSPPGASPRQESSPSVTRTESVTIPVAPVTGVGTLKDLLSRPPSPRTGSTVTIPLIDLSSQTRQRRVSDSDASDDSDFMCATDFQRVGLGCLATPKSANVESESLAPKPGDIPTISQSQSRVTGEFDLSMNGFAVLPRPKPALDLPPR